MPPATPAARLDDLYLQILRDYPVLRDQWEPRRFESTIDLVLRSCPPASRIVDIGAWPGTYAVALARLGLVTTAVDKDPLRPIAWARDFVLHGFGETDARIPTLDALCRREGITAVSADLERDPLPFEDASQDAVLCSEVIEHLWHDPIHALSEMNRILKPTGLLILTTNNLLCARSRLDFFSGRIDRVIEHPFVSFLKAKRVGHMGHLRQYAPRELMEMLQLLGFSIREESYTWYDAQDAGAPPAGGTEVAAATPAAPAARPFALLRKIVRPPGDYVSALIATTLQVLERRIPRFRPQIALVATKVTDADFNRHHPEETARIVARNTLAR